MFKWLSMLTALSSFLIGLVWIASPISIVGLWGVTDISAYAVVERRLGVSLICVAAILFFARNAPPSPARSAIVGGIVIGNLGLFAMNAYDLAMSRIGTGIVAGMTLQLLIAAAFAWAEWRAQKR